MIVLVTCPKYFPAAFSSTLEDAGFLVRQHSFDCKEDLLASLEGVHVLCHRVETRVDQELVDRATSLRVVASATAGLDHVDQGALHTAGITLLNDDAGCNRNATAEMALALIMSLGRNIRASSEHISASGWERHLFIGREIHGSTLGIVGCGDIGSSLASKALSLGMLVLVYDPFIDSSTVENMGAVYETNLNDMIRKCDAVSVHCPLNEGTHNLIGHVQFSAMRPGSVFVNASRGACVNTDAVTTAVTTGGIKVALDVFDPEPPNDTLVLLAKSNANLLLTPHIGGSTIQSIDRCADLLAKKILSLHLL